MSSNTNETAATAKSQLISSEAATVGSQSLPVFLSHLFLGAFEGHLTPIAKLTTTMQDYL